MLLTCSRRAVDISEGDKIDERAFKALVRAAAALNTSPRRKSGKAEAAAGTGERPKASKQKGSARGRKPALLAGGNPQIAKGDGDAPVQAYIEAMPGWKSEIGRRLDALIVRGVPGVRKAVKWNSLLPAHARPADLLVGLRVSSRVRS